MNAWGNAYVGKYRGPDGIVAQLVPLDPRSFNRRVGRRPAGLHLHGPERRAGVRDRRHPHVRMLSLDGIVGVSPIGQVRNAFGLAQNLAIACRQLRQERGTAIRCAARVGLAYRSARCG